MTILLKLTPRSGQCKVTLGQAELANNLSVEGTERKLTKLVYVLVCLLVSEGWG